MEATKDFKDLSDTDLMVEIEHNIGIGTEMLYMMETWCLHGADIVPEKLLCEATIKMGRATEMIDELWRRYKEALEKTVVKDHEEARAVYPLSEVIRARKESKKG